MHAVIRRSLGKNKKENEIFVFSRISSEGDSPFMHCFRFVTATF
jgi:hypothetical protein